MVKEIHGMKFMLKKDETHEKILMKKGKNNIKIQITNV